jgi:hypothetical protein
MQYDIATSVGRPHRRQMGSSIAAIEGTHVSQNGQEPRPHPAHRGGKNRSRTEPSTRER